MRGVKGDGIYPRMREVLTYLERLEYPATARQIAVGMRQPLRIVRPSLSRLRAVGRLAIGPSVRDLESGHRVLTFTNERRDEGPARDTRTLPLPLPLPLPGE